MITLNYRLSLTYNDQQLQYRATVTNGWISRIGHWPSHPCQPTEALNANANFLFVSFQPSVPEICIVTVMSSSGKILGLLGTVVLLCFGQLVKCTEHLTRNVSSAFNEGCNIPFCKNSNNGSFVNVFHISARGQNDTIHFVWSSYGALTGLVAQTKNSAVFKINWEKLKNKSLNAISFEPKDAILFSSGVIFSRLIEFDDVNDTAILTPASKTRAVNIEALQWNNFNVTVGKTNHSGVFISPSLGAKGSNGFISLLVQGFQDDGRGIVLPQLLHTSNSSYFEFALKNITTNFAHSRFALELVFVHQDKKNKTKFSISRSIADQYTPAVFYVDNVKFIPSIKNTMGGYVSWKPVTYTKEERHLANGKLVHQYGLKTNVTQLRYLPSYSIAHAFWGDLEELDITSMNISFGIDQDGFYKETNYTIWCGLVGYGDPPLDRLSLLIIVVISASIGIPVVLIVLGGSFMSFRNLLRKKKGEALLVDPGIN